MKHPAGRTDPETEKRIAAWQAVTYIESGMVVGLGSGSTSAYMIRKLGEAVSGGLKIQGVPSSKETEQLAREAGIPLISLDEAGILDLNIDGADEFDPELQLIKGGGGALLREKIVAYNSKSTIIIADSSKQVERLGRFKLPVETVKFATRAISTELEKAGLKPQLRMMAGAPYLTDEQNHILDIDIFETADLQALQDRLLHIPGIVETGLFLNMADRVIMGKGSSILEFKRCPDAADAADAG